MSYPAANTTVGQGRAPGGMVSVVGRVRPPLVTTMVVVAPAASGGGAGGVVGAGAATVGATVVGGSVAGEVLEVGWGARRRVVLGRGAAVVVVARGVEVLVATERPDACPHARGHQGDGDHRRGRGPSGAAGHCPFTEKCW